MFHALTIAHHAIGAGQFVFGLLVAFVVGLLVGVHMNQPRYMR